MTTPSLSPPPPLCCVAHSNAQFVRSEMRPLRENEINCTDMLSGAPREQRVFALRRGYHHCGDRAPPAHAGMLCAHARRPGLKCTHPPSPPYRLPFVAARVLRICSQRRAHGSDTRREFLIYFLFARLSGSQSNNVCAVCSSCSGIWARSPPCNVCVCASAACAQRKHRLVAGCLLCRESGTAPSDLLAH